MLFVFEVLLTVVVGVEERVLVLLLLLRDTAVDELLLLRVIAVDELEPEETAPFCDERVVAEFPLNVLSLRPVELTDERDERLVFVFVAALFVELRALVASPLNEALRPVVADDVVLRLEVEEALRLEAEEALRDDVTAELRLLTPDDEV